ncbi:MAG: CinA family protein [Enterobacterales bacterium]|nr:CinA family protein [Enterobacterales bacterium]
MQARTTYLAKLLSAKQLKLITIESCTGGLLGAKCTDVAGSSSWFEAGYITYSNRAKQVFVGVEKELIERYGAVSKQVAIAMAKGGAQNISANN